MARFFTTLAFCLTLTSVLFGQQLYTVQVGTFLEVRSQDFDELRPLGFIYGNQLEGNLTQVFLGNYSDLSKAETVTNQLRARGFKNAQVLQRPIDAGQSVVVIQLTTQTNGSKIDWAGLDRAGELFVENDDQLLKILTGIYPNKETALQLLPAIRELGYKDAFIKSVNNARLVPITSFETGIKKPLIPITLGNEPPVAPAPSPSPGPQVVTYGGSPTPAVNQQPTPVGYGNANPTPAVSPSVLPNIRGRFKRTSAQKLQVVLKEKGYYTGEIDGYYGNGTATAYRAATEQMPEIQKMRLLSSLRTVPAGDYISQWPEVTILMTTATEMSGGRADQDLALRSIGIRQELYNATQALSPAAASRARAWELTLWENLDSWATTDPLHAQLTSVLRVAYYQSQVRLEDYFMDRGLPSDAAKDLALATLQGLIGAELERFL